MGQLGPKLRRVASGQSDNLIGYAHWCPACQGVHVYAVDQPNHSGAKWTFNGDITAPSFSPSMLIRWGRHADPAFDDSADPAHLSGVCHYFLTASQIQFCGDCTHAMRGQMVPLPDLPEYLRDA